MTDRQWRTERDSLGDVRVPKEALYGAQTQRAVDNFGFSGRQMRPEFIGALAIIKAAAAHANRELGLLESAKAEQIIRQALAIADGAFADQFPVDVFQTGSGTSTNMNMNEVIARLAGEAVHPNDDVNMSQSSNDVIPACIQVSATLAIKQRLLPAVGRLQDAILVKADATRDVVKTGRTHLMDALPLTLSQELGGWAYQFGEVCEQLEDTLSRLRLLPLGGTAVGTGVNSDPRFAPIAIDELSRRCGEKFDLVPNRFSRMSSQDTSVQCSSCLKGLAIVLMKVANDLRWMGSGPLSGLAEIELAALQPGSSIMPGKVNPVVPEAVTMIAAAVMGNDVTIGIAAQSGNFQLNVMLPLVADKLLEGINLLSNGCDALAGVIRGFTVNEDNIRGALSRNPILVTALNARVGYDVAAKIAKRAYREGRPIVEVAHEETGIPLAELAILLDPARLARPHG